MRGNVYTAPMTKSEFLLHRVVDGEVTLTEAMRLGFDVELVPRDGSDMTEARSLEGWDGDDRDVEIPSLADTVEWFFASGRKAGE